MKSEIKTWLLAQFITPLFAQRGPVARRGARDRRGVALVIALLFIVLLTVLVVEFSYETQVDASLASNSTGDLEAYLAAKSAVAQGMSMLWDHLTELQNGEDGTGGGPIDIGKTTQQSANPGSGEPYDSKYDQWAVGIPFEPINDATMRVTISDEYGKFNLNALFTFAANGEPQERPEMVETLRQFFITRLSGGDAKGGDNSFDPTDAILDWLDYGESEDERSDGAEDDFYMGLDNPYHCKNGPMDSIEELLLIKGITPEIYFGEDTEEEKARPLSDYLTVHGHWGGAINVNTAQPELLEAVNFGYNAAGRIINPNAMNELLARLGAGETIYSMGELQQIGGGTPQSNRNNPPPGKTPNEKPTPPKASALQVAPAMRVLHAALPRPQAVLDGFWTPSAALASPGSFGRVREAPAIDLRPTSRIVVAQGGATPKPPIDPKDPKDPGNPANPGGRNPQQVVRPFTISSNCFRIYGDGMQGDVLVRIEAYVWRNSPLGNPQELQAMLPPQLAQQWTPPTENFRILDWKVIR